MQRTCTTCGEAKPLSEYRFNPRTGRYSFRCVTCPDSHHLKMMYRYASLESYLRYRYYDAVYRRKGVVLEFSELLEILEKQGRRCAITGKEFTYSGGGERTNVSIDRIDSDKPYEKNNVRLVCAVVNAMRSRMTDDQFADWCVDIAKGLGRWK